MSPEEMDDLLRRARLWDALCALVASPGPQGAPSPNVLLFRSDLGGRETHHARVGMSHHTGPTLGDVVAAACPVNEGSQDPSGAAPCEHLNTEGEKA